MSLFRSPRYVDADRRTEKAHDEAKATGDELKRRLEALAAEHNPLEAFTRSLLDARNHHEMFGHHRR
jgi:hypothetical protein